jgi:hypothetical protein
MNPSTVDPTVYEASPLAAAWFVPTAGQLLEPIPGYLAILAAHNLPCERYTSTSPGRVIYKDPHQVVVVPHEPENLDQATTFMWLPRRGEG